MASLIDELIAVLQSEEEIYRKLIPISERKTEILVRRDLKELQRVTEEEQGLLDQASALGHQREKVIQNMGMVLNRAPEELDLASLIDLLAKQPAEKKRLSTLHDSLIQVMKRLVDVNEKNKDLIETSLEMIEFNMNFIQSTRMSPGNNNYDRNAASTNGMNQGYSAGSFDAKQ
ncbi:MAG: flagellar protein FlgN [Eubacteriales bacterium]|nr:flagellar protein FlgN [Eubacteriales bacterium]